MENGKNRSCLCISVNAAVKAHKMKRKKIVTIIEFVAILDLATISVLTRKIDKIQWGTSECRNIFHLMP